MQCLRERVIKVVLLHMGYMKGYPDQVVDQGSGWNRSDVGVALKLRAVMVPNDVFQLLISVRGVIASGDEAQGDQGMLPACFRDVMC